MEAIKVNNLSVAYENNLIIENLTIDELNISNNLLSKCDFFMKICR